jgi:hypothetical protein
VLAQPQRPLPSGAPLELVARSARVSVVVADSLDPDRLRDLARPGVTAWVTTASNTLRSSTLEHLARFDKAWLQLRAPLAAPAIAPLLRLPHVGAWVSAKDLSALRGHLPAGRALAVQVEGELDEATLAAIAAARPTLVSWSPGAPVSLLQWGLFRQLSGRKILVSRPGEPLVPAACAQQPRGEVAVELHLAVLLALNSEVFPCGAGKRVLVPVSVDRWLLQSLVVTDPSVELVFELGGDDALAGKARAVLDALGRGPPR